MFFHLNDVPVGSWIWTFCWAVEKSGYGRLMSPGTMKTQKSMQKLQVRFSQHLLRTHRVSAPMLGLGVQNQCLAFIK